MPKAVKGSLIQCDPPQMAMILEIDKDSNHSYVIEQINDTTCVVKENKVDELKRRVKQRMDRAMGIDETAEEEDMDSDLEA